MTHQKMTLNLLEGVKHHTYKNEKCSSPEKLGELRCYASLNCNCRQNGNYSQKY